MIERMVSARGSGDDLPTAVGLPELIARTPEEYVAIAAAKKVHPRTAGLH